MNEFDSNKPGKQGQPSKGPSTPPPAGTGPLPPAGDLTGTTWEGKDSTGDFLRFTFLPGGVLEYQNPGTAYRNATWKQSGSVVQIEMNNHYADYEGVIKGDVIDGSSHNVTGKKWTWSVRRMGVPLSVPLPAPTAAKDVLGTTWVGTGVRDEPLTMTFLPGGVLRYTTLSGTWENGRWEQHGERIQIDTNNHYADYEGTLSGGTIKGSAHNVTGLKWTWQVHFQGQTTDTAPTGLGGSVWDGTDSDGMYEIYTFLPDGHIGYTTPSGSYDNGIWTQTGNMVHMTFNNGYATYDGTIDGGVMRGSATNTTGKKWNWTLRRKK